MKEPERLVIKRKQHPKLCCSSQQEKLLAVEELEHTLPFIDILKKDVDLESVSEIKTTKTGNASLVPRRFGLGRSWTLP